MQIIYMGTPQLAVAPLQALAARHHIIAVVTQPDRPLGRSKQPVAPPVKEWALANGVPVLQPERARNEEFVARIRELSPQAIAVVAYGQILPTSLLQLAPRGCINLHYSLLPRWRGAAPVQHALLAGDTVTGVTTQWMAPRLDAGDIVLRREVPIEPEETTADLWQRLTPIGSEVLLQTFLLLEEGTAPRTPQDEAQVTVAPPLTREDGRIAWDHPAAQIVNQVRAVNPWPGAWCTLGGDTFKIWRARVAAPTAEPATGASPVETAPGSLRMCAGRVLVAAGDAQQVELIEVQAAGRPRLAAAQWARGARPAHDAQLN